MEAVLERRISTVLARMDKKCGKSGIPEDAKCTKATKSGSEKTSDQDKRSKSGKSDLLKNAAIGVGAYATAVYGTLLVANAMQIFGDTDHGKKIPDFKVDDKFNPEKIDNGQAKKIGEGWFGEAFLDKEAGVIYKRAKTTTQAARNVHKQVPLSRIDPVATFLGVNLTVDRSEKTEFAAQYIAGETGVAPKLYGKKGRVVAMEYLDGYSTSQKIDKANADEFNRKTARAIAKLHIIGLAHNDLHGGNIMHKKEGGKVSDVKIIDYGLASIENWGAIKKEAIKSASVYGKVDSKILSSAGRELSSALSKAKSPGLKRKAIADFYVRTGIMEGRADSRLDAPNECQTGERCGETCIDPKETCNVKNASPELAKAMGDLSDGIMGALPGVGQAIQAKKLLKAGNAAIKVAASPNFSTERKIIMTAVALAGVSVLAYSFYKANRRNALSESANIAKISSMGIVPMETKKSQITFAVDGGKGGGGTLKSEIEKSGFDTHEVIDFSRGLAEDGPELGDEIPKRDKVIVREAKIAARYFASLGTKRSDHAVDLAAQILAYQKKYPSTPINIVSHGHGGHIAMEAADIVKKANPADINYGKLKVLNLQTVDYGIYNSSSNTITLASSRSKTSMLPMKGKVTFRVDDPGDGTAFFHNTRSLTHIKGFLEGGIPAQNAAQEKTEKPLTWASSLQSPQKTSPARAEQPSPPPTKPIPSTVPRSSFAAVPDETPEEAAEFQKRKWVATKGNIEQSITGLESNLKTYNKQLEEIAAEKEAITSSGFGLDDLPDLENKYHAKIQAYNVTFERLNKRKEELAAHLALKKDSRDVLVARYRARRDSVNAIASLRRSLAKVG